MKKHYTHLILGALLATQAGAAELNVAKGSKHPYADTSKGRDGYQLANETANEKRLYDFYQRQADYYMDPKNPIPAIIPSYPGLDGGEHGHWGKHNQNGYKDGRWNEMGQSSFVGQQGPVSPDSIAIQLGGPNHLHTVFSAKSNLTFARFWDGNFVHFNPYRWGTSSGAAPAGKTILGFADGKVRKSRGQQKANASSIGWQVDKKEQKYIGMYDADCGPVFEYQLGGSTVLDHVSELDNKVLCRRLEFTNGLKNATLALFEAKGDAKTLSDGTLTGSAGKQTWSALVSDKEHCRLEVTNGMLLVHFKGMAKGSSVEIYFSADESAASKGLASSGTKASQPALSQLAHERKSKWSDTYTVDIKRGADDAAYVVDTIPLPFKNENKSLMFFTDIVFDQSGTAYISTLMGEIWKVTGLTSKDGKVTWDKFATGLNQPFGMKIWDGKLHVLEREQITTVEDLNGDGEADFYGNFSNAFQGLPGSHTHTFGMERDSKGYTYLVAQWAAYRISPDGQTSEELTKGLRNCMGFGKMSDDTILVGPQEGTNTPTSTVIELKKGDNHGFKNKDALSIPLGYVPRGVDNSTGGFLEVDSERWGPLGKNKTLIGICYGYGSWYQILFDENAKTTGHRQIASVPMPGEFLSGVTRGAVNPADGQVYLVGLDGWGDYAIHDGCLHRLRYTGKDIHQPVGYEVFDNGIKVNFPEALDAKFASNKANHFAQMWNYKNSRQYGSPEYSVKNPESLGHDPLPVTSAMLSEDGKSLFVEIPDLQPAMQMQLRMHLKSKEGVKFQSDIFPTIVHLGKFINFAGAQPKNETKDREFHLMSDRDSNNSKEDDLNTQSGKVDEHARQVKVKTIMGLKYNLKDFKVKAGESVALVLHNEDSMPHNLVIVKPGAKQKVGEAAFKMMNDPKALEKSYVPDDKADVVAFTKVVDPKGTHTTYFVAPKEKGKYPFICTFPGHWQVMQGVMIVE
ncbi:Azurin [Rubritalea squalenifaciens DSM 18772]|uniref:Azurin n=1 Tax=Rubritalea squalenifaciens DSM 18772 TaxID=1123071 RepID=A0A1M6NYD1_9BACT|nr:plastocyanin/azurin family copper-binding protein [Rubritalea squalenifaciens]SHK00696.1 Azurin [Rubritalea squalenifaciens DSM 18772]